MSKVVTSLKTTSATAATTSATGSIKSGGGVGVAKNAWIGGNFSNTVNGLNGAVFNIPALTFTDSSTSASGTAATNHIWSVIQPTIAATNASVTTTRAATMYVGGAPIKGTNETFTNAYGLYIDSAATTSATVTEAASLCVANAPTVTSGTAYALKVTAGNAFFGGNILGVAGTAAVPSISFSGDANTGIFSDVADTLKFTTGGTERVSISTTALTSTLPMHMPVGDNVTPSYSFTGYTNTGMFYDNSLFNAIVFAISGNGKCLIADTFTASTVPIYSLTGTAAAPAYAFDFNAATGLFLDNSDLGFSVGGVKRLTLSTTALTSTVPIVYPAGTAAAPSITFTGDTNTGIFSDVADTVKFSTGGTERVSLTTSALTSTVALTISSTTAATSSTVANLINSGGIGVAKNAWIGGNFSNTVNGLNGAVFNIPALTFTDSSTSASGTAATNHIWSVIQPTIAATNASVTTTRAATMYVGGAPIKGTNETFTNAYGLYIDSAATTSATVTEAASLCVANAPTVTSGTAYALKVTAGNCKLSGTTDSSSSTADCALSISGGLAVAKSVNIGKKMIINGTDDLMPFIDNNMVDIYPFLSFDTLGTSTTVNPCNLTNNSVAYLTAITDTSNYTRYNIAWCPDTYYLNNTSIGSTAIYTALNSVNGISFSCWFNKTADPLAGIYLLYGANLTSDPGNKMFDITIDTNGKFAVLNGGSSRLLFNETTAQSINRWTHYIVTLSPSGSKLYRNGVELTGGNITYTSGNASTPYQNFIADNVYIGENNFYTTSSTGFKYLSNFMLSTTIWSAAQVLEIYNYQLNQFYAFQVTSGYSYFSKLLSIGGTDITPTYSFYNDSNTGIFSDVPDTIQFSAGGAERVSISTTDLTSTLPITHPAGTAAAPSIKFTNDTNTGIFSDVADTVKFTAGGTERASISTTALTSTLPIVNAAGTAAAPSITFTGDTNTGIYSSGSDVVNISTGGTSRFQLNTTNLTMAAIITSTTQPILTVKNSGAQNINDISDTKFTTWGTPDVNIGFTSFTSGTLTIAASGVYAITWQVSFESNTTGNRTGFISTADGAVAFIRLPAVAGGVASRLNGSIILKFAAADTLSLYVTQTSGDVLATGSTVGDVRLCVSMLVATG